MNILFQLYSARNFPPTSAFFPKLGALGYSEVEGYGDLYKDASELAIALKESGLSMPTGHFGLQELKDVSATLKTSDLLGIKTLICPWLDPKKRTHSVDGWKALGGTLSELSETYRAEQLNLCWHNHDFEFNTLPSGEIPMEVLLSAAPDIGWQFDVAWSVRAGHDPISWINKYGNRIVSVHAKDIAAAGKCLDEDGWADLAYGTMDWNNIIVAIKQNTECKSFVLEHDNPSDVDRFASRSIQAANDLMGVK